MSLHILNYKAKYVIGLFALSNIWSVQTPAGPYWHVEYLNTKGTRVNVEHRFKDLAIIFDGRDFNEEQYDSDKPAVLLSPLRISNK